MTIQVARTFATVIALPVAKLQADAVINSSYIFLTFASDEELSQFAVNQDQIVAVTPKSFAPAPGVQAGGGRNNFKWEGSIDVRLWNRIHVDQAGRDDKWMHHSTLGMALLVHNVLDSLEQYYPSDSSGYYMTQPMRLQPPGVSFPPKRVGDWGAVTMSFSLMWQESLS